MSQKDFSFGISLKFRQPLFHRVIPVQTGTIHNRSDNSSRHPFSGRGYVYFCIRSIATIVLLKNDRIILYYTDRSTWIVLFTHPALNNIAMLNDAVKKGGVMASNHVGGLSGAFIPVSEDDGMIKAAECGSLTLEKLEAMTAVCSVGIDMVVIPGDTTAEVISGLIADEAAIGMVNSKTTAVRVIPAIGHKAGDVLDFGGLLGHAPIMPISQYSPAVMIHRGGRIPAPMQALKN